MKIILELPDNAIRAVKIRAAETDRKLRDVVAELIQWGLENATPADPGEGALQEWASKLVYEADGSVSTGTIRNYQEAARPGQVGRARGPQG